MERSWRKAVLVAVAAAAGLCLAWWLARVRPPSAASAGKGPEPGRGSYSFRRIVCMSPAVTEIVFAAGAGDRVVGVSQHAKWPPEALAKPSCGGFFNPSFERIMSLSPDLIIAQGEAADLGEFARAYGIELRLLELRNLDSILAAIGRVGELLEREAQAELVAAEMRYRLAKVRARVSDKPPVGVLLVTGREPGSLSNVYTVGPGTFLHDLLRVAGGRNVFADLPRDYAAINKEAIIERRPEVIVELHGEGGDRQAARREVRQLWKGMPALPAVWQGRVHVVTATYAMVPGPRVVRLAESLAEVLHGEGEP
ncbi:MAG: helical backbone metal receptor [Candidatus Brocadiia bacterium]